VEVAGPVTPEVREEIMGTNGYVKAVLKEGDLVTVQKLYDLEPVVVVELKSAVSSGNEGSTGEGESKVRFSSLEEPMVCI